MRNFSQNINPYYSKNEYLKVLHVVLSLEPGGMENGVVNVSRILHGNGFMIYVCCLERAGDFAVRFPNKEGIFVLNKPPGLSFKTILKLSEVIRKIRPHIVHTHNFGPLIYTTAAKFISPPFKLLHGEHGMIKPEDNTKFKIGLRKFCYKQCDLIHTVSCGLKDYFVNLGFPPKKILPVFNGVDTEKFKPEYKLDVRRELNLPENAIILGVVGRFDRGKRHRELIEAFNNMADNFKNVYLLFVGDGGTDCDQVKEIANRSPYRERIIFAGYQRNMAPYYQAMDILIIPSLKEGFPNVLLEAMACGIPALAHPTPGTSETITDGKDGFLRNLESVDMICESVKEVISDLNRIKFLGECARQKVQTQFSLQKMANDYADVYRNLCYGN